MTKALFSSDPANPDHYRFEPVFSGLKFLYSIITQVWWVGDSETVFTKFDQVVRAFDQDRTAKVDWENSTYWRNKGRVRGSSREEHIQAAREAIAVTINQVDNRMEVVKKRLEEMAKKLDGLGGAVSFKRPEEAFELGKKLGS